MEISKLERILVTRVDYLFVKMMKISFGWLCVPVISFLGFHRKILRIMYFDYDIWSTEGEDMADCQLFKLGLDVDKINNDDEYLGYNVFDRNSSNRDSSRRSNRHPTWI